MLKNFLAIFNNSNSDNGYLKSPGDKLEARVTKTNRQVVKIENNNGKSKYSATRYPNGTTVETKTTKK